MGRTSLPRRCAHDLPRCVSVRPLALSLLTSLPSLPPPPADLLGPAALHDIRGPGGRFGQRPDGGSARPAALLPLRTRHCNPRRSRCGGISAQPHAPCLAPASHAPALPARQLYVGNVSFYTTEAQIYELFSTVGHVNRVIMGLDRNKKSPCGFCFVM